LLDAPIALRHAGCALTAQRKLIPAAVGVITKMRVDGAEDFVPARFDTLFLNKH